MTSGTRSSLVALCALCVFAWESANSQAPADTSRRTAEARPQHADSSGTAADSAFHFLLPPLLGSVEGIRDSAQILTREALQWVDGRSLNDVLGQMPGFFVRDQQSAGQYSELLYDGTDWRSIAVLANGRPMADPISGIYNLQMASPEFLEQIETVTGPRSFRHGSNGAGATINLATRNYNSNRPFTRLRYMEGDYGFHLTDGTFAQNMTRRLNVTAGFQSYGADARFVNSADDQWNFRAKLRYAVNARLFLIASEYFTATNTRLNGGVDPLRSLLPFDPNQAEPISAYTYEKVTRHDVDLTGTGMLFPDTLWVSTISLYYSNSIREYRDEAFLHTFGGKAVAQDQLGRWSGAILTQTARVGNQELLLGGSLENRRAVRSPTVGHRSINLWAAWVKDELSLGDVMTVAAYLRTERLGITGRTGVGADLRLELLPSLTVFGGVSSAPRFPTMTEAYWADSTVTRRGPIAPERHTLVQGGMAWQVSSRSQVRVALSVRRIDDPILPLAGNAAGTFPSVVFVNGDREQLTTLDLSFSLRPWRLLFEGTGSFMVDRSGIAPVDDIPRIAVQGGAYFRDTLFNGNLDLKVGVRGWYRGEYHGRLFNPQVLAYITGPTPPLIGQAATVDGVLMARLGDATIHFTWENLPDIRYYATPYAPGNGRAIRLGVTWDFWN